MPEQGLKDLYIDELKDLYNAENQLVKALPKMAKAASSDELRQGFEEHLEQTRGHVQRLEKIFESLGERQLFCDIVHAATGNGIWQTVGTYCICRGNRGCPPGRRAGWGANASGHPGDRLAYMLGLCSASLPRQMQRLHRGRCWYK